MARHSEETNWRLEVELRPLNRSATMASGECEAIREGITKAIKSGLFDEFEEIGQMIVRHDWEHTCSHCGRAWTEESDAYNGGCCAADEDAHQARAQLAAVRA